MKHNGSGLESVSQAITTESIEITANEVRVKAASNFDECLYTCMKYLTTHRLVSKKIVPYNIECAEFVYVTGVRRSSSSDHLSFSTTSVETW